MHTWAPVDTFDLDELASGLATLPVNVGRCNTLRVVAMGCFRDPCRLGEALAALGVNTEVPRIVPAIVSTHTLFSTMQAVLHPVHEVAMGQPSTGDRLIH